jgi:hypothetical protein
LGSRVRPNVFYRSDFSHPISHRTPHYRVGNGVIGWLVISQKRLNFGMKRNYKIQGEMGCNGLGNRCSTKCREPKFRGVAPADMPRADVDGYSCASVFDYALMRPRRSKEIFSGGCVTLQIGCARPNGPGGTGARRCGRGPGSLHNGDVKSASVRGNPKILLGPLIGQKSA